MSIGEQLQNDLKDAMRSREEPRLTTIRSLRAAIKNEEVNKRAKERNEAMQRLVRERNIKPEDVDPADLPAGEPLTDAETMQVIRSEIKKRQDSVEVYRGAGRADAAAAEEAEIEVLRAYLPQQMTADELRPLIQAVIAEVGASSKADMKKVMPVVMSRYRDRAEGRTINQVVQELLG